MSGRYKIWDGQAWVPCDFRLQVGMLASSTGSDIIFGSPVVLVWDGNQWVDVAPAG